MLPKLANDYALVVEQCGGRGEDARRKESEKIQSLPTIVSIGAAFQRMSCSVVNRTAKWEH